MYRPIHENIHAWYAQNGRLTLPWRKTQEPYEIYLSEVMLQQTQVKTVLERFYFPFLEAFPTLQALGQAPLDDVLKLWEGLGYYNRAKNLHATAKSIAFLPQDIDTLMALKGIGKNTAHALASFAFGQAVPIMEANVKRILCRVYALENPKDGLLWDKAYLLLDKENSFDYNQAMMDIGATICKPKTPFCELCPLESICQGKDNPSLYPLKKIKKVPTREENVLVYAYNESYALSQRKGKFLHGLWGFESVEVPLCASEYLGEVSHAYTHFKLKVKVYIYHENHPEQERYFCFEEIKKVAISKVDEKILKLVNAKEP